MNVLNKTYRPHTQYTCMFVSYKARENAVSLELEVIPSRSRSPTTGENRTSFQYVIIGRSDDSATIRT
jgi:hypothetical protein